MSCIHNDCFLHKLAADMEQSKNQSGTHPPLSCITHPPLSFLQELFYLNRHFARFLTCFVQIQHKNSRLYIFTTLHDSSESGFDVAGVDWGTLLLPFPVFADG